MRSDVILYVMAVFFFALAFTSTVIFTDNTDRIFWMTLDISLGIAFLLAGYHQRPKAKKTIKTTPTTPDATTTTETIPQPTPVEETSVEEPSIVKETAVEEAPVEEAPVEEAPVTEPVPVEAAQTIGVSAETPEAIIEAPVSSATQEQISPVTTPVNEAPAQVGQAGSPLTNIKGVGEKRAAQLNALGITTAEELSQVSVEDLAKSLKISPKIAAKLVEAAKQ
ncbi:MAG: hypothetical protein LBC03_04975 [Nitrososphaerota archaeon]|jgi:predicted flap endonuclease-1-like 5' DNA nuclease|nr:hypothetical protein [Nitrososphaerota archaeon]